jgi:hypothetical protein
MCLVPLNILAPRWRTWCPSGARRDPEFHHALTGLDPLSSFGAGERSRYLSGFGICRMCYKSCIMQVVPKAWGYIKSSEFTNLVMALATVAIAVFTWLTYEVVSSGSEDTRRLITAAETQARAADKISGASDRFTASTESVNEQTKEAVKQFRRAADASERNIRTIQRSSQEDRRAWLGILVLTDLVIKPGEEATGWVVAQNSGRTPALQVHTNASGESVPKDAVPDLVYRNPPVGVASNSVVPPQGTLKFRVRSGTTATQDQVNAIKNGTSVLYIYGKIRYLDIFKRQHDTIFCFVVEPDLTSNDFCDHGNDAN